MDRILSRGMRLAFGAAVLVTTGFGVNTALAEPSPAREAALRCAPGFNKCVCSDGYEFCAMYACPRC